MNTVSVLICVYKNDNPTHLKEALNSVFNQTTKPDQIVLVKDGPITNDLNNAISNFSKYENFLVITLDKNYGLAKALNTGLLECTGEYIARMDADDVCLNNRLHLQKSFLESNPTVDVVGSSIIEIDSRGKSTGKITHYPYTHDECKTFFIARPPLAHPSVMFRRSYFKKISSFYNEHERFKFDEDSEIWMKGFLHGCIFANIQEPLLKFRINEGFFNRRNGFKFAYSLLKNKLEINKALNYPFYSDILAVARFFVYISPPSLKKLLYKHLR